MGRFSESIALEHQEAMHVPDILEVVFPPRFCADSLLPRIYEVEDSGHDWAREGRRAFGKAANKFVKKLFC